ncbi:type VII secretion system-associated protein [Streptomyces sp. AK02-01A]|uniref:type VII secretion system-associated protein n=1 Tax=Streptomyces sp. AK02-01A TaxID=3028648 RepID=UPI0029A4F6AB|nr:type VII secretion system-associated protein [Streptomyces sp. AK02-01A]MDX3849483.1 type VII secretion system-associated protein [Streptomyces sp. AK02-01A]
MSDTPDQSRACPDAPEDIREAARIAPDHWFGMVDPTWRGHGNPPAWAVIGEWRSGTDGEIEEWRENEDYRPSPAALGWPDPTDSIDQAVQLAVTGYGRAENVIRLLATANVQILLTPDDLPLAAWTTDNLPVVPIFTSDDHVRTLSGLGSRTLPMADVMGQLPSRHRVYVNPTGAVGMVIETEPLNAAIAAAQVEAARSDEAPTDAAHNELPADQHGLMLLPPAARTHTVS